jgi:hypothetical protein
MKKQHVLTILVSLSDRAEELQKNINRANESLEAGRDPEFWLNDREYWENRMKEVEEAREAVFALPDN